MLGFTPVALITKSASSTCPVDNRTVTPSPAGAMASTLALVNTCTPLASHQSRIMLPATGPIMRGTMRSPISTTDKDTPRTAKASMMMQPMKPAPICTTRAPGLASAMMARASASVQHGCTCGLSMPGIGGRTGREPVAINSLSNFKAWLLSS